MDGVINIRVNGYSMVKDSNCAGAQYEANSMVLRLEFSEDWDEFARTVTFWDALGQTPTKVILGNVNEVSTNVYCIGIPEEVLTEAGMITFTVNGYLDGVKKRTVADSLKVLPSRKADDAEEPAESTPTPHEQLQLEIAATEEKLREFYQGGETDEVKTSVGYVTSETLHAEAGETVRIYVGENDVRHDLTFSMGFYDEVEEYDAEDKLIRLRTIEGNFTMFFEGFSGKRTSYYQFRSCGFDPESGVVDHPVAIPNTIVIEKTSNRKTVLAELKEKAVELNHLADEVLKKINEGTEKVEELRKQIPTKISQMDNDAGYLTEESDPTVPDWATQPNKPTYTADEVGAIASCNANSETATVKVSYGNETAAESIELAAFGYKEVVLEDGVLQYIIEFETVPTAIIPLEVYTNDKTTIPFPAKKAYSIIPSEYAEQGGIEALMFTDDVANTVTITKVYERKAIVAEVKEGSIQPKHLSKEYYTKDEVDDIVGGANLSNYYTKEEIDSKNYVTRDFVDQVENRVYDLEDDIKNVYTKTEVDSAINNAIGVVLGGES